MGLLALLAINARNCFAQSATPVSDSVSASAAKSFTVENALRYGIARDRNALQLTNHHLANYVALSNVGE